MTKKKATAASTPVAKQQQQSKPPTKKKAKPKPAAASTASASTSKSKVALAAQAKAKLAAAAASKATPTKVTTTKATPSKGSSASSTKAGGSKSAASKGARAPSTLASAKKPAATASATPVAQQAGKSVGSSTKAAVSAQSSSSQKKPTTKRQRPPSKTVTTITQQYRDEITKMMFTSGNSREADNESCALVEDIVRSQMIALAKQADRACHRRAGKCVTADDVMFTIRADAARVARLSQFILFKKKRTSGVSPADTMQNGVKKAWEWDFLSELNDLTPEESYPYTAGVTEAVQLTVHRSNQVTQHMPEKVYAVYAEAKKASFTQKKVKKFRDWAQLNRLTYKFNDDAIEVMGFLAAETVGDLVRASKLAQVRCKGDSPCDW